MNQAGLLNMQGFGEGTDAGRATAEQAYTALKNMGLSEANIQEALRQLGYQNASAYGEGVSSGEVNVSSAYETTFSNPLEARSSLLFDNSKQKGLNTGTNFADGIESSTMDVTTRSQMLGQTATDNLDASSEQAQLKGNELGNQFAGGIDLSKPTVDASTEAVGQGAVNSLNSKAQGFACLLYTSPSPRDQRGSRMPSSA